MPDRKRIGFDRTIASEWLDASIARAITGEGSEATRRFLWNFLEDVERGVFDPGALVLVAVNLGRTGNDIEHSNNSNY